MLSFKVFKDYLGKAISGVDYVPRGLLDLNEYFRHNGSIKFIYHNEGSLIVAVSENFRFGSLITHGKDMKELDRNIKDAILTAFEIPSAYALEAKIKNETEQEYALA